MHRLKSLGAVLAFAIVRAGLPLLPAAAEAQATGRIAGVVRDSSGGRGLAETQISVIGTRFRARADADGNFAIPGVPVGSYSVEARRIGYRRAVREKVEVSDGATTTTNFTLVLAPLTLEAIVTTGVVDPTSGTRVPSPSDGWTLRMLPCRQPTRSKRFRGKSPV